MPKYEMECVENEEHLEERRMSFKEFDDFKAGKGYAEIWCKHPDHESQTLHGYVNPVAMQVQVQATPFVFAVFDKDTRVSRNLNGGGNLRQI